ncbi:MAG: cbb3-type cytochrome oxidase assembly protein CcoS [Rubripirellula sp.]
MSVLYIALPIAVAMGGLALWACVRCIRGGQFDDLDTPPMRMLIDEPPKKRSPEDSTTNAGKQKNA